MTKSTTGLPPAIGSVKPLGERIMLHGRKLGIHLGVNLQTDEDRAM